ncbi:MAG: enoyl-CoA hydratase-related protein, partial [Paracoccaceae bacterium]
MTHAGEFLQAERLELGPTTDAAPEGNWRFARDGERVAWLVLDRPGSAANTVSAAVLRELDAHLDALEADLPAALVIRSAKPGGFAMGADLDDLASLPADEVETLLRRGHGVLDRLAALDCPTVAVIHGAALGAGLELALACDARLAVDGASAGFPEVRLGLHPGLGGTVRLPALIAPDEAMTLMLTGKTAHTRKARRLGLFDEITQERHVRAAITKAMLQQSDQSRGLRGMALETGAGRALAARRMRARTQDEARPDHYPAPHRLIDLWESHGGDPDAMQEAEIASFAKLLETDSARNLMRVFFLRQHLKRAGAGESGIERVHVVGAGEMGAGIAAWVALKGARVTLGDLSNDALGA